MREILEFLWEYGPLSVGIFLFTYLLDAAITAVFGELFAEIEPRVPKVPKVPKVPTDAETCLDKMFDKWGQ